MIDFLTKDDRLVLRYIAEFANSSDWVREAIKIKGFVRLKKTFYFEEEDILSDSEFGEKTEIDDFDDPDMEQVTYFLFAKLIGDYYKVKKGILINDFDIFIHKDVSLSTNFFVADSDVSVVKVIKNISLNDLYLGGNYPSAVPVEEFEKLLKYFPTSYERRKYVEARIASLLRNYLDGIKDAEKLYQKHLNTKLSKQGTDLTKIFQNVELVKYQTILEKLQEMLKDENQYSEHQWQEEILQIILLLYPKYIFAFKSVPIQAKLADGIKGKQLDFLLVDSNGYVDVIEIKKPFENAIMTKGVYRENYIPLRELSGTVMQIEKYIYYLNRWSLEGEKFLSRKYETQLPEGFDIKIANPSGVIIMGRENNLSPEQKNDFEVVKRKYKNIVDIITYDNLLERLQFTIEQIRKI
ncbi:Shedu immune nuclease family protein [Agriterribacter sp.]|jgi:hypothetical protein|uniref:Shedu immune nuclease family protein n=1 Tax=Agriterribacter sp. TaxID=2821509 RepID=UPI002CC9556F|nr:Shedu immune nuclease family protein [Agriterribacter sp.]HRO46777.1 DUF4263 domain-containing protein [Agriterribacter sp.]HRQ18279.1 DUF4263 domain-containing protein [Agriterribacter sp.]